MVWVLFIYFIFYILIQFQQREILTDVLPSQVIKCVNRDIYTEKFLNYRSIISKELERNLSKTGVE